MAQRRTLLEVKAKPLFHWRFSMVLLWFPSRFSPQHCPAPRQLAGCPRSSGQTSPVRFAHLAHLAQRRGKIDGGLAEFRQPGFATIRGMPHLDPHARMILVSKMVIPSHEKSPVEFHDVWQRAKGSEVRIKAASIHRDTDRALRSDGGSLPVPRLGCVAEVGSARRGCRDGLWLGCVKRGQRREQQGGEEEEGGAFFIAAS